MSSMKKTRYKRENVKIRRRRVFLVLTEILLIALFYFLVSTVARILILFFILICGLFLIGSFSKTRKKIIKNKSKDIKSFESKDLKTNFNEENEIYDEEKYKLKKLDNKNINFVIDKDENDNSSRNKENFLEDDNKELREKVDNWVETVNYSDSVFKRIIKKSKEEMEDSDKKYEDKKLEDSELTENKIISNDENPDIFDSTNFLKEKETILEKDEMYDDKEGEFDKSEEYDGDDIKDEIEKDVEQKEKDNIEKDVEEKVKDNVESGRENDEVLKISKISNVQDNDAKEEKVVDSEVYKNGSDYENVLNYRFYTEQKNRDDEENCIQKDNDKMRKKSLNNVIPPMELLKKPCIEKNSELVGVDSGRNAKKLIDTLNSFGVKAKILNVSEGPSVTRYEVQPDYGVKVSKIVNLTDDIALNLAATCVRIEAPIPGKAAVGIEIPNTEVTPVLLREVIDSYKFSKHTSKLSFAVGKDIAGTSVIADIATMPHLLIAGATGSGKSVCINTLIASLIYKASPDEVRFLMIDPKVVELGVYNGIPHLLIPVITEPKKAAGALNWAVHEMTNRYKLFADNSVRDLKGYNDIMEKQGKETLPQIVIIIDELSDLMMVAPNDVEDCICRLAQMARAAGMHLVIATQRPSVNVITGVIKANVPSRISFAVSSQIDSRTILDMSGAEKLLGKGDMLFSPLGVSKPVRVQGAFITDKEVESIVSFIKSKETSRYDENILKEIDSQVESTKKDSNNEDELLPQVINMVIEQGQASTSLIQRKFKIGYSRAARILDSMEAQGIVGSFEGSKPRKVLITKSQWQERELSD
ncbi:DNA translocase FtsK [Herbivorax sp. ANBcel31]|uniref:DNA translocase FtsK n=1 Tax=Herbivorax sp. ANBcel31 TaxID=3069754 RepID=UPI0027B87192|nr:DNA translocase FtsK [Herbivorax sp. ANBcel31]MDQ2084829.1 DNA translocase FtsK [Herbivorax sp. ANBcel31]